MNNSIGRTPGTDWAAIALWTLIPLTVAAGFISAALTPEWESNQWITGLLVLIPLELVRALVFSILSETYRDYQTPRQAVGLFLTSFAILLIVVALLSLYVLGFRDFVAAVRNPEVYRAIGVAVAIIVVDGVIGLVFFRGDARRLSARLQAVADDARDWLQLGGIEIPVVLALGYGVLLLVREAFGVLAWIPNVTSAALRLVCLMYAAFYFLGKAVFLAHANTGAFNRTGQRLLGAEWVQFLIWKKNADRETDARSERASERKRRAILLGDSEPAADS